ncbi:related to Chitin-binding protein [Ustilago trichophora]|uniref:Related to Chitin-binding protein n=1 Tax=Ustilago trichophora TaxID=86804 RepID=A0A5C3EJE2_9BASI|nr:related to Chitin-binding protein [Ustilago trichophora]
MTFRISASSFSLFHLVALVATLSHLLIGLVDAHGYVNYPASRSYMCKQGQAKNCGEIQYEPQSVEAPKGLPFARNSDGKLCSAGLSQFSELDRQGAKVWPTTKASDVQSFSWTFTAQHATTNFKYYITKPDWDSTTTRALTATDFESHPFLVVPMNAKAPARTMNHDLSKNMPSRSGYHVVYAVWTVDNTVNAFYQCIDLDFGGKSSSGTSGNSAPANSSGSASANTSNVSTTNSGPSTTNAGGNTSSSAGSSSGSSAPTTTTTATDFGSSANSSASTSSTNHKNNAAKGSSCRLKRRRAPSASILAARADFHRQKMQFQRKRQA